MVGVFLQEKDTRLQDFEPKVGVGICPRVGLYPELDGTVCALDPFHKTSNTNTRRSARFSLIVNCVVTIKEAFSLHLSLAANTYKHDCTRPWATKYIFTPVPSVDLSKLEHCNWHAIANVFYILLFLFKVRMSSEMTHTKLPQSQPGFKIKFLFCCTFNTFLKAHKPFAANSEFYYY